MNPFITHTVNSNTFDLDQKGAGYAVLLLVKGCVCYPRLLSNHMIRLVVNRGHQNSLQIRLYSNTTYHVSQDTVTRYKVLGFDTFKHLRTFELSYLFFNSEGISELKNSIRCSVQLCLQREKGEGVESGGEYVYININFNNTDM